MSEMQNKQLTQIEQAENVDCSAKSEQNTIADVVSAENTVQSAVVDKSGNCGCEYEQPLTPEQVKALREKEARKAATKRRYLIAIGVAVAILVLVAWMQGLFAGPSEDASGSGAAHWVFTKLCDVFFIDGAIFLAAGGLLFCDKHGAYDTIAYGVRTAVGVMFRSPEKRKYKDLYEYKKSREGKHPEYKHLLWIALVLLAFAVLFLVLSYTI